MLGRPCGSRRRRGRRRACRPRRRWPRARAPRSRRSDRSTRGPSPRRSRGRRRASSRCPDPRPGGCSSWSRPRWNVTPSACIAPRRRSAISASRNGRRRGRPSTSVTSTPIAANIAAYSQPMTPPPTMTIVSRQPVDVQDGVASRRRLRRRRGCPAGDAACEPVATRNTSPVRRRGAPSALVELDGVCVDEARGAAQERDAVALEVPVDARDLELDTAFLRDRSFGIAVAGFRSTLRP